MNTIKITLTSGVVVEFPVGTNLSVTLNGVTTSFNSANSSFPMAKPTETSGPMYARITDFNGYKIDAIKAVRELSGLGLGEAKAVVENYQNFRVYSDLSMRSFDQSKYNLGLKGIRLEAVR